MSQIILEAIFICLSTWAIITAIILVVANPIPIYIFAETRIKHLPYPKLISCLAIFIACYILFLLVVSNNLGGSFWIDEAVIALKLSELSIAEILTLDFHSSVGRFVPYLLVSKLFSFIYNVELLFRITSFIAALFCFYLSFLIGKRLKSPSVTLFLFIVIFLNSEFIKFATTFKPYTLDMGVALTFVLILIHYDFSKLKPQKLLKLLLISSLLASISFFGWVGTISLVLTWYTKRSNYSLKETNFELLKELKIKQSQLIALIITIIWLFNIQYILRGFFSEGGQYLYSFISRESVDSTIFSEHITGYLKILRDLFLRYTFLAADSDLGFQLLGAPTLFAYILLGVSLICACLFYKHQLILFSFFFFSISVFLNIIADWPFDAERWNMALIVFAISPTVVGISHLTKKNPSANFLILMITLILQFPFFAHNNSIFYHSNDYWLHRGHPTTHSRENLELLEKSAEKEIDIILTVGSDHFFTDYYLNFYEGAEFKKLENSKILRINPKKLIDAKFGDDENRIDYMALAMFWKTNAFIDTVEDIARVTCPAKTIINGPFLEDGTKHFRAAFAIFDCNGR